MTQQELDNIVERHQHWLKEDCEGWEGMRANLGGANLRGANLCEANLGGANLGGANLSGANLDEKERHRLGQILKEPITGYKKTAEGVVITAEIPAASAERTGRRLPIWAARNCCTASATTASSTRSARKS